LSDVSFHWYRTIGQTLMSRPVLRLSDGTSEKNQIPKDFHWYKIQDLLYKRALFDLQFVHYLFLLKLKWNARSKVFYCIYRSSINPNNPVVILRFAILTNNKKWRSTSWLTMFISLFSFPTFLLFSPFRLVSHCKVKHVGT
jgi:hypothetical protein